MKPYAVHLLKRFRAGESIAALARNDRIPAERVRALLAIAAELVESDDDTSNDSAFRPTVSGRVAAETQR